MFRITATLREIRNRLPAIRKAVGEFNNARAIVGWETREMYPGTDLTVAQVAVFNEYGTQGRNGRGKVPARPFMRQAYHRNLAAILKNRNEAYRSVIEGRARIDRALMMMGYRFQEMLRAELLKGDFQPNAPSTLARKKQLGQGSRPLIASKRMINALRTRVELNGADLTRNTAQQDEQAQTNNAAAAQGQAEKRVRMSSARTAKRLKEDTRKATARERKSASRQRARVRAKAKAAEKRVRKKIRTEEKRKRQAERRLKQRRDKIDRRNQRREHDRRHKELKRVFGRRAGRRRR